MSIEAVAWAFRQEIPNPGAKLVLLALCDYADESWSCFPGQETLATKTSQGERTVRRHLEWLEREGFIVSRARFAHGRRTSNRYTIHSPSPNTPPLTPSSPRKGPSAKPVNSPAEQAAEMTGGQIDQRSSRAEQPARLAGEPSENHQQKHPQPPAPSNPEEPAPQSGCDAHPARQAPNCRGCGTNLRALRKAAEDEANLQAVEREQLSTNLWLQAMRTRRGEVEQQERDGSLARARQAVRAAVQRRPDEDASHPTGDIGTLTEIDHD
ncbi:helix-turn-helix domain-containing protein [Streptomyces sp. TRM66268-LWL]|uniref:Helix-turn-helix domain-containing protein n=1 Tax=Streptomyces polyasparticus TaxID=2767826 RepID=A0ABR7ST61_9ACTN|nr:helix-turn-helix domain-containing protein [Streptomyces polyasparticus]MBC9717792.1 helix-turn-helix domain-containing protein [Streptomyces polyasparticus]